jgi:hypothetical protein
MIRRRYTRAVIAVMLLMLVGGIGLAQAVSDPRAVSLRWLRLGGMIAVALLGVATTIQLMLMSPEKRWYYSYQGFVALGLTFLLACFHLYLVQTGERQAQRIVAALVFVLAVFAAATFLELPQPYGGWDSDVARIPVQPGSQSSFLFWFVVTDNHVFVTLGSGAGLVGGTLITMLLGHAYLTAGSEMTQKPFRRLVVMLAVVLLVRTADSLVFGALAYWNKGPMIEGSHSWNLMMITARYAVGLIVPAVFLYMIYDCVRRRANQSATGILYVTLVLVIVGEGAGLALLGQTGYVF